MTVALQIAAAGMAGAAVGVTYFAGLWTTVRRLPAARHPARVLLLGLAARFGLAVAAFTLLAGAGRWRWAAAGLAGFLLGRTAVLHRVRLSGTPSGSHGR